jgi:hypothetical protein
MQHIRAGSIKLASHGVRISAKLEVSRPTDNDVFRPAPIDQAARIAAGTAMVWDHQYVAVKGGFGQQIGQTAGLQITRKQNPPASMIDLENNAVGIVIAEDAAVGRMQDFQRCPALFSQAQLVACEQFLDRYVPGINGFAQLEDTRRTFVPHHG